MSDKRFFVKVLVNFTIVFFAMVTVGLPATFYVDSTQGNDTNDGLSPESAWATIEKVNGQIFLGGDYISFKRGELWEGTINISGNGENGNYITVTSYGEAEEKPVIDGGDHYALQLENSSYVKLAELDMRNGLYSLFIDHCNGIIIDNCLIHESKNYNLYAVDCSDVIIENCAIYNSAFAGIAMLDTDGFNISSCHIYDNAGPGIFSLNYSADSDPMSTIDNCEISTNRLGIITFSPYGAFGKISHCDVHHNQTFGIYIETQAAGAQGAIIEYNETHYNSIKEAEDNYFSFHNICVKGGKSIVRYNNVHHAHRIDQGGPWDGNHHDGGGIELKCSDCECYGNLIYENDGPGIQMYNDWGDGNFPHGPITGLVVHNNTLYDNGKAPGDWDKFGAIHCEPMVSGSLIQNNIIHTNGGQFLIKVANTTNMTVNYNDYYDPADTDTSKRFRYGDSALDFTGWQNREPSFDSQGIHDDPLFADVTINDFHLKPSSPCIDRSNPNTDYSMEPEPHGCRENLGAYGNTCDATTSSDTDSDNLFGGCDNCPIDYNPEQDDLDNDGVGNSCDNCCEITNPSQVDIDCDGLGDACDNCPNKPNGPTRGICVQSSYIISEQLCTSDEDCPSTYYCMMSQEDNNGNGIGDACACPADYDGDGDIDGVDASLFKLEFGRNNLNNPCTNEVPCHTDFDCDQDCDGLDVLRFKKDFGRGGYVNPCPKSSPTAIPWCAYPE